MGLAIVLEKLSRIGGNLILAKGGFLKLEVTNMYGSPAILEKFYSLAKGSDPAPSKSYFNNYPSSSFFF